MKPRSVTFACPCPTDLLVAPALHAPECCLTRLVSSCSACNAAAWSTQGTKACLGWERVPDGGLHACTAVVDAWLRLLQRALHAVRALRVAVPAAPEYMTIG